MQIVDGRLSCAVQFESPNFNERPAGEVSLLVIHGISLPIGHFGGDYVRQLFLNQLDCSAHPDFADLESLKVSSHLVIRRDGAIDQFVPFDMRAWHAGMSNYEGRDNCNDFSIGIELEGTDMTPYRSGQYAVLVDVCATLVQHFGIPAHHVATHSEIAPGRKTDPGPAFDWHGFRQALARRCGWREVE